MTLTLRHSIALHKKRSMDKFSVNRLAKLAGVSVRTLHRYDGIGLLKPAIRAESKYRYYGKGELLRLQQILLYKEMDFTLAQIAEILGDPDFDLLKALGEHKRQLPPDAEKVQELITQYFEMTGGYFDVTYEIYRNMGTMYVEDARFAANFEKYAQGLAVFVRNAIHAFCDRKTRK